MTAMTPDTRPRVFVSRRIPDEGLNPIVAQTDADIWPDDMPPARDELLRRLGRDAEARDAFRRALALIDDEAERRLLERRLEELGAA